MNDTFDWFFHRTVFPSASTASAAQPTSEKQTMYLIATNGRVNEYHGNHWDLLEEALAIHFTKMSL